MLNYSSSILISAIIMRFKNEKELEEERDLIKQNKGLSYRGFNNISEV